MKIFKLYLFLIIFLSLCFVSIILSSKGLAIDGTVDQRCRVTSSLMGSLSVTGSPSALSQQFKPTQNGLAKISIYVDGDGIGTVKLWLKDMVDGGYIINSNGSVAEPNGKGMIDFLFESTIVVPGRVYSMMPVASDKSKLDWFNQEDCYANGSAYIGNVEQTFDFAFQTYSYLKEIDILGTPLIINLSTPTPGPTEKAVVPTPTSTPLSATPTSIKTINFTPVPLPTSSLPSSTPTLILTPSINAKIPVPVLLYVLHNFQKIEDLSGSVNLNEDDEFILYGSGDKNSKIIFIFGNSSYEVEVSDTGEWLFQLPINNISAGDYILKAQAQVGENGSEIIELIKINLSKKLIGPVPVVLKNNITRYYPYIVSILLILIGLVLLGIYFDDKKKKLLKINNEVPVAVNTENVTAPIKNVKPDSTEKQ